MKRVLFGLLGVAMSVGAMGAVTPAKLAVEGNVVLSVNTPSEKQNYAIYLDGVESSKMTFDGKTIGIQGMTTGEEVQEYLIGKLGKKFEIKIKTDSGVQEVSTKERVQVKISNTEDSNTLIKTYADITKDGKYTTFAFKNVKNSSPKSGLKFGFVTSSGVTKLTPVWETTNISTVDGTWTPLPGLNVEVSTKAM